MLGSGPGEPGGMTHSSISPLIGKHILNTYHVLIFLMLAGPNQVVPKGARWWGTNSMAQVSSAGLPFTQQAANSRGAAELSSSLGLIHYSSPTQILSGSRSELDMQLMSHMLSLPPLYPVSLSCLSVYNCRCQSCMGWTRACDYLSWWGAFLPFLSEWKSALFTVFVYCGQ